MKYLSLIVIVLLAGCEQKECEKWETRKETVIMPVLVGMINNVPQYTYFYSEEDRDYCVKYKDSTK